MADFVVIVGRDPVAVTIAAFRLIVWHGVLL
jgi:hypothetical protein